MTIISKGSFLIQYRISPADVAIRAAKPTEYVSLLRVNNHLPFRSGRVAHSPVHNPDSDTKLEVYKLTYIFGQSSRHGPATKHLADALHDGPS